jgi:hypothetical protein
MCCCPPSLGVHIFAMSTIHTHTQYKTQVQELVRENESLHSRLAAAAERAAREPAVKGDVATSSDDAGAAARLQQVQSVLQLFILHHIRICSTCNPLSQILQNL